MRETEYNIRETIEAFDAWWNRGQRLAPVEASISALYWLERADLPDVVGAPMGGQETIEALAEWIDNEEPNLPDVVGEAALYWLRIARRPAKAVG